MRIGPRLRLVLIASLFAAPIAASFFAYFVLKPDPSANYGELLLPPASLAGRSYAKADGGKAAFSESSERWTLATADGLRCDEGCAAKLHAMRQVRLALGRNASRVERVLFLPAAPSADFLASAPVEGMSVLVAGRPPGAGVEYDPAHIYLVDPHSNVMMRWPARPDMRRMLKDLERLLKASQIG